MSHTQSDLILQGKQETNTNVLKTTLAGFICYYYSIQSNCDRKGCTGNESETFQRRTKRTCSPWTPQSAFIHIIINTTTDWTRPCHGGKGKDGTTGRGVEGYAGLDSPPHQNVRLTFGPVTLITFGPVTLRTSDPSDQCPFGPVTCNRNHKFGGSFLNFFNGFYVTFFVGGTKQK